MDLPGQRDRPRPAEKTPAAAWPWRTAKKHSAALRIWERRLRVNLRAQATALAEAGIRRKCPPPGGANPAGFRRPW